MSEIHLTRAVYLDTKEAVSIESVNSGLQENVVCACCGAKLVANKGKKKAWYFSHYFDEACLQAYETQLHLTAKEYFTKVGRIPMPIYAGWVTPDTCAELNISNVRVEVYMDGRRPDLVVEVGSEQYWIEIANKHKCDADKIWECRANSQNVIEIDVSNCGYLDTFDSLDNCLIRIQSINPCNDYFDEIAHSTASKHEKVRKQFEALVRSQKKLEEEKQQHETKEKSLEQRIEAQKKKHEEKLQRMKLRESAQDELLAELEQAIDAQELALGEIKTRKANLEAQISEQLKFRLSELEMRNEATLKKLIEQLEDEWQQELSLKREQLEHNLKKEFQRRFQAEVESMDIRRKAHEQLKFELNILVKEKDLLVDDIDGIKSTKQLVQAEQVRQIKEQIEPLVKQRDSLVNQVEDLENTVNEKLIETELVDTYANNLAEVKEFCLARSDYRETLHQRMKELTALKRELEILRNEYDDKYHGLDVVVKLSNEYRKAFKQSLSLLQQKDMLDSFPQELVNRIRKNVILLSRNAEEELADYERLNSAL